MNRLRRNLQTHDCPLVCLCLVVSQEEESSSSSSEEEEGDQRQNDDLFGKVVCVEAVTTGDKKKASWYPALVSRRFASLLSVSRRIFVSIFVKVVGG